MAKSKYQNYEEYELKDKRILVKALRDELHKAQTKIEFLDGSYYSVTKSGTRQWGRGTYSRHRETGPASVWLTYDGYETPHYSLFDVGFRTRDEWVAALDRLRELRELTDGNLETIVEHIALNVNWGDKHRVWKTVLANHEDSAEMIENLKLLSDQYRQAKEILDLFVKTGE